MTYCMVDMMDAALRVGRSRTCRALESRRCRRRALHRWALAAAAALQRQRMPSAGSASSAAPPLASPRYEYRSFKGILVGLWRCDYCCPAVLIGFGAHRCMWLRPAVPVSTLAYYGRSKCVTGCLSVLLPGRGRCRAATPAARRAAAAAARRGPPQHCCGRHCSRRPLRGTCRTLHWVAGGEQRRHASRAWRRQRQRPRRRGWQRQEHRRQPRRRRQRPPCRGCGRGPGGRRAAHRLRRRGLPEAWLPAPADGGGALSAGVAAWRPISCLISASLTISPRAAEPALLGNRKRPHRQHVGRGGVSTLQLCRNAAGSHLCRTSSSVRCAGLLCCAGHCVVAETSLWPAGVCAVGRFARLQLDRSRCLHFSWWL